MSHQHLSIKGLKHFYQTAFDDCAASDDKENFINFLKTVVKNVSAGLQVDLALLDKDLRDDALCNARRFGAIESLRRTLLAVAEGANYKASMHPDWSLLAGRLETQRLKLNVPETFDEMIHVNPKIWRQDEDINYLKFISENADALEQMIVPERDYDLYFFGVRTLEKSYLAKIIDNGEHFLETPQRLFLRIAAFLWMPDLNAIKKYYDLMSTGKFTHASPTMFHAGIAKGSLASCFLLSIEDDLTKIFTCLSRCAQISKAAGGIGLDITKIRHSQVGHMGQSSGIVPMLKVYDATMRYVDQCFDPDTFVYTKTGPKRIGDVTTGEKLVTLNGFGTVAKPMHYKYTPEKQMYSIKIKNYYQPVVAAGVHPMLVLPPQQTRFETIKSKLATGSIQPEFAAIEKLKPGYIAVTPIPSYTKDLPMYDTNDCYMYGLMICNGWEENNHYGIVLKNANAIDFVEDYLRNCNIHYTTKATDGQLSFQWHGGATFPITSNMLKINGNKSIHQSMLHLPKEKCMAVIKGVLNDSIPDSKEITYNTNSQFVIEAMRYMLLRFGICTKGLHQKEYTLRIPLVKDITNLFGLPRAKVQPQQLVWNGLLFSKITEITPVEYTKDTIVELEMVDQSEKGANYLTAIGCAHNGGRRKGSATIFLQPWHIDFLDFLQLKRQHGTEERRVRDLFYSVWSCDIFMERVERDEQWTMFCPKIVPELNETFGEEFDKLYLNYEKTVPSMYSDAERNKYVKQMPAREVWYELLTTQIEAGMPFMGHKDTANYTSNQQNLGLIRSSNLCMEITEVTDGETISSCNLASIALDEYIDTTDGIPSYNFKELGETVRLIVQGINRVIDKTFYPLQETDHDGNVIGPGPIKSTNLRYRPTGIGVQALADAFLKMNMAWTDMKAKELNRDIFATIYYYAVDESCNLAQEYGSYDGFQGSPASRGLLKPDLLALERARKELRLQGLNSESPNYLEMLQSRARKHLAADLSPLYDWDALRKKATGGMRNSLLVALMPTASSAQIRYKNESFEPFTTNLYVRSVLAGNHLIVNRYMVKDLQQLGLWNPSVINHIKQYEGSIANIPEELVAPEFQPVLRRTKEKCRTAFELSQKLLLNLSIDRSYYVCQSQSFNVHKKDPTFAQLGALHMYAWKNALTTGMYYLRSAPSTEAIKFTVEGELDIKKSAVCSDDICLTCQS